MKVHGRDSKDLKIYITIGTAALKKIGGRLKLGNVGKTCQVNCMAAALNQEHWGDIKYHHSVEIPLM